MQRKGDKIMKFQTMAATSPFKIDVRYEYNLLSGDLAGICYMPNDFKDLIQQPKQKKSDRAELAKKNGHHSVFDHEYITIYLEDVPKMFAMLLNNEKVYATSEKSARYTKMQSDGLEYDLYTKWQKIFIKLISEKYPNHPYFTPKKIEKLALENARYFLSVYTPTSFAYTASYRQLSYIYSYLKNLQNSKSDLLLNLIPTSIEFCDYLEKNHLIDKTIASFAENREFSLIAKKEREEYFGDVYSTSYYGSFAQFAQAQRHRSLNYEIEELNFNSFYIPKIIKNMPDLKQEWITDMIKVSSAVPQGKIIKIYERGTPENFILKLNERLCSQAQLEICQQTEQTLLKYINNTTDEQIKNMLSKYSKGARCKNGFNCPSPCGFGDGINLQREI